MTCPSCSAPMYGPVRVMAPANRDPVFGGVGLCHVLAHRWTCPCGCVVVVPVGEGRTP